jgi:hypothetical protein
MARSVVLNPMRRLMIYYKKCKSFHYSYKILTTAYVTGIPMTVPHIFAAIVKYSGLSLVFVTTWILLRRTRQPSGHYWLRYNSFCFAPYSLHLILFQMTTALNGAARDDRSWLKSNGLRLMLEDPDKDVFDSPLSVDSKSTRGFNHKATARLLCPQSQLASFDADPIG